MPESTNVVSFKDWFAKQSAIHIKKSMLFLGKAETALKEHKEQWAKKFSEMAQSEIKIAAQWQDRFNKQINLESPPIEVVNNRTEPMPLDYAKWMSYQANNPQP